MQGGGGGDADHGERPDTESPHIVGPRAHDGAAGVGDLDGVLLNALDGFDVLAIHFSSPDIVSEWSVDHAALGILLSMELIGMAAGSVLLG